MRKCLLFLAALLGVHLVSAQTWSPLGSGIVGFSVYAMEHDTLLNQMVVGGKFNSAGGTASKNLAIWDIPGQAWLPFSTGSDNPVRSLLIDSMGLVLGGDFTTMGGVAVSPSIALWNGTTFESMGTGFVKTGLHAPVPSIYALEKYKGQIYAAGVFDQADGANVGYIARWDSGWKAVGPGVSSGPVAVYDLEVYNDELYVAGDFDGTLGVSSQGIMKWDGTNWSSVGGGANNSVFTLEVYDGELYAGGPFTTIGGASASRIARWNGFAWGTVDGGAAADVTYLKAMGDKLYVTGIFTSVNSVATGRFAWYQTSTGWHQVTDGLSAYGSCLATDGNTLYAGGPFTTAGGVTVDHITTFDPTVGVNDPASANHFRVSPIPADDHITLEWEGTGTCTCNLFSSTGALLLSREVASGDQLDLSAISPGICLLQLTDGSRKIAHHKILINH